jgi:hypothetical protein
VSDGEAVVDDGTGELRLLHSQAGDAGRIEVVSAGDPCAGGAPDD